MAYRKINVELIVFADEADSVVADLNAALDQLEEAYALFGGEVESVPVEHSGVRRKTALTHAIAGGGAALAAVKLAGEKVASASKKII